MHRFQLFPALCVLHELLLLLQHLGKAAGGLKVEGRFRRSLLLRLRSRAGVLCGEGLLCEMCIRDSPLREEKSLSQRAFSIYTDIRKLQDKAKTSYTLSTRRLRFGYEQQFSRSTPRAYYGMVGEEFTA